MSRTTSSTLGVPPSTSTVEVSIIDAAHIGNIPTATFMEPSLPGFTHMEVPAFSFLLTHRSSPTSPPRRVLFDLGVRKDWATGWPPAFVERTSGMGWTIDAKRNVSEILADGGLAPSDISEIIWSHWHIDHTGDPSTFPPSTTLVVGPGFKSALLPGYPEDPAGVVSSDAFAGREVREVEFPGALTIGGFDALDYFGDGSFYLLSAPGHAIGHMCGLARTTADSFILLGADTCHHAGALRPSAGVPLPAEFGSAGTLGFGEPHTTEAEKGLAKMSFPCPGAVFAPLLPHGHTDTPFYSLPDVPDGEGLALNREQAVQSLGKLVGADAKEDVLVVIAHDASLLGAEGVRFFPETANGWREEGWKGTVRWRFLAEIAGAL